MRGYHDMQRHLVSVVFLNNYDTFCCGNVLHMHDLCTDAKYKLLTNFPSISGEFLKSV
jgi:hypothetical protein